MSLTPQLIVTQRARYTKDAAGGDVVTWTTVDSNFATVNFYRSAGTDEARYEEATHNAQGPGVLVATRQFLCYEAAIPNILPRDQVTLSDGSVWLVLFVRNYTDSAAINVQVDIEIIQ